MWNVHSMCNTFLFLDFGWFTVYNENSPFQLCLHLTLRLASCCGLSLNTGAQSPFSIHTQKNWQELSWEHFSVKHWGLLKSDYYQKSFVKVFAFRLQPIDMVCCNKVVTEVLKDIRQIWCGEIVFCFLSPCSLSLLKSLSVTILFPRASPNTCTPLIISSRGAQ